MAAADAQLLALPGRTDQRYKGGAFRKAWLCWYAALRKTWLSVDMCLNRDAYIPTGSTVSFRNESPGKKVARSSACPDVIPITRVGGGKGGKKVIPQAFDFMTCPKALRFTKRPQEW